MMLLPSCLLLLFSAPLLVAGQDQCGTVATSCPSGCWHLSGLVDSSGFRECVEVGPGFYSPVSDNLRYRCDVGTFSNVPNAALCNSCSPGSYADAYGSTECHVCPSGTYSDIPQATHCNICDPTYYNGEGANSKVVIGSNVYCYAPTISPTASTPQPTPSPSLSVITVPTAVPSSNRSPDPSQDSASIVPYSTPSPTTTSAPSVLPPRDQDKDRDAAPLNSNHSPECQSEDFYLHGSCAACPGQITSVLRALGLNVFFLLVCWYFASTPTSATAIFFVGMEYFQLVFLVGTTHTPWTSSVVWAFETLGLLTFDWTTAIPIQCYLNLGPQSESVVVVLLPIGIYFVPWFFFRVLRLCGRIDSKEWRSKRHQMRKVISLGLYLSFNKMLLASMELLGCSTLEADVFDQNRIDWFCSRSGNLLDGLGSVLGLLGIALYGLAFPLWFSYRLWQDKAASDDVTQVADGSIPDRSHRMFTDPFRKELWWWMALLLLRRLVTSVAFFALQRLALLVLLFIMVQTIMFDFFQRVHNPFQQIKVDGDVVDETNCSCLPTLFHAATVDLVLKASLICIATFGLLFRSLSVSESFLDTLNILLLAIMVISIVYFFIALLFSTCGSHRVAPGTHDDRSAAMDIMEAQFPDDDSKYMDANDLTTSMHLNSPNKNTKYEQDHHSMEEIFLSVQPVAVELEWSRGQQVDTMDDLQDHRDAAVFNNFAPANDTDADTYDSRNAYEKSGDCLNDTHDHELQPDMNNHQEELEFAEEPQVFEDDVDDNQEFKKPDHMSDGSSSKESTEQLDELEEDLGEEQGLAYGTEAWLESQSISYECNIPEVVSFDNHEDASRHGSQQNSFPLKSADSMGSSIETRSFQGSATEVDSYRSPSKQGRNDDDVGQMELERAINAVLNLPSVQGKTPDNESTNSNGDEENYAPNDWRLHMADSEGFLADMKNTTLLESKDRVEPVNWGKRHSQGF